jgi:hypothetical protein
MQTWTAKISGSKEPNDVRFHGESEFTVTRSTKPAACREALKLYFESDACPRGVKTVKATFHFVCDHDELREPDQCMVCMDRRQKRIEQMRKEVEEWEATHPNKERPQ